MLKKVKIMLPFTPYPYYGVLGWFQNDFFLIFSVYLFHVKTSQKKLARNINIWSPVMQGFSDFTRNTQHNTQISANISLYLQNMHNGWLNK